MSLCPVLEEHHGQVRRRRLRARRIVLDELDDRIRMRLSPGIDEGSVRRVGLRPRLSEAVVRVGPLRDDVRLPLEPVLLEPGLDVGRDRLPCLRSGRVFGDRTDDARDAVAQRVVRRGVV